MPPPPPRRWRHIAAAGHLAGFLGASFLIHRVWRAAGAAGLPLPIPPEGAGEWALALIRGAIIPATLEELFFRGLVFEFVRRAKGERAAIGVSAVLFGLAHPGLAHGVAAGLLGLYLGTLRARWGLALPIVAHVLNNALELFWDAVPAGDGLVLGSGFADPWSWLGPWLGLGLAVGLVGNSVAALRQEMRNAAPALANGDRRSLQPNPTQDENGR